MKELELFDNKESQKSSESSSKEIQKENHHQREKKSDQSWRNDVRHMDIDAFAGSLEIKNQKAKLKKIDPVKTKNLDLDQLITNLQIYEDEPKSVIPIGKIEKITFSMGKRDK